MQALAWNMPQLKVAIPRFRVWTNSEAASLARAYARSLSSLQLIGDFGLNMIQPDGSGTFLACVQSLTSLAMRALGCIPARGERARKTDAVCSASEHRPGTVRNRRISQATVDSDPVTTFTNWLQQRRADR